MNFNKNEGLEILCLKISIAARAPTDPPTEEIPSKALSEILRRCSIDFLLSKPKMINVKRLMIIKYNIEANLK